MIVGVGIDVVDIDRFEETLRRTPALRDRLFTADERDLPTGSLAARFAAKEALAKAPGVERWEGFADGATLRAAAGRESVLVGRVRQDPSRENGLLLWLAVDLLRLSAANAVRLAVGQLGLLH